MFFHHPTITSLSHDGETYTADERGVIEAPASAAEAFAAFGVLPWTDPGHQAPQAPKPISQWSNDDLKAKAVELGLELPEDIKRAELIQAVTGAIKGQE